MRLVSVALPVMILAFPVAGRAQAPEDGQMADRTAALEARVATLEARVADLEALLATTNVAQAIAEVVKAARDDQRKSEPKGDAADKANWKSLKKGMTKKEVRRLLGEPDQVATFGLSEEWQWDEAPWGKVSFNESGEVDMWFEPTF